MMMMKTIELTLHRKYRLPKYSIGKLYINGQYFCDTLEDTDRNLYQGMSKEWIAEKKIYGETAIPYGRYKITMKVQSTKYPQDTLGCILVGYNKIKGAVVNSTTAFWKLYDILKKADDNNQEIWLTITQ